MPEFTATLISYALGPVRVGGQLTMLGSGDTVTVTAVQPPCEDDDPGTVTVRLPWGETRDYDPSAVGCYFTV